MKIKTVFLMLLALMVVFSPVSFSRAEEAPVQKIAGDTQQGKDELREKWGIQILAIRISAGGYMLDFRYRVLDPKKAAPLFDRKNKPVLTHEKTGAKFAVPVPPKVGSLRQTRPPVAGKNYFMIFANPAKYVKQGDTVTVTAGDFTVQGLTVE